jgi:aubergine-like protein
MMEGFTVDKKGMSAVSNILLQMNIKLGNSLWLTPKIPGIPPKTMIIGADVNHMSGQRSIVGLVATTDDRFSKYFSQTDICKSQNEEIMERIGLLVEKAVQNYVLINKSLPENIIIYRDGVGESQFDAVMKVEVRNVLAAIKKIGEKHGFKYNCKIMEVIVQKKINERFF